MRWEDCIKRDLERVGGKWRTTEKDRRSWRMLIKDAVREKCGDDGKDDGNHGQPLMTGSRRREQDVSCKVREL